MGRPVDFILVNPKELGLKPIEFNFKKVFDDNNIHSIISVAKSLNFFEVNRNSFSDFCQAHLEDST